jgi:excisionase family DNA binding protein
MVAELLDKRAAAALLKISVVTLDRLRHCGELPYRKIGSQIRFLPSDLDRYIAGTEGGAWKPKTRGRNHAK